ncbi:hypothetical protein [Phaeobacter gallaeciensis]|uniref:hypothetical protein n=1 Tax=Phaeobacter gallaeciensis TaxID=60890 RepID=UPI00237F42F9|nr:hypothetical protein [Phaeobacter gallaeciensis]MDE4097733.1 hypothetical protein [Phaeobacter gallaeciensis]MDE4106429.1 hypothetical protein [Phaeobacter gallaeciensis]MDE4110997.1 hypothetical protein [Phaeobacter gallaeciensis]MDE4115354.1 hypothetical protein [Phaeobacter gallaeciensis]MDE4119824.1 hypothetical protein [Phaeobacter gallaeciensis]
MMRRLRIYIGIFLSLAVVLTAHSAAAMRGARDASGQIVICTGTGPVAIYVDSEGQPVPAPHYCPDCVMHLLDAGLPVQQALPIPARPVLQDLTPDRTVLIPVSCGQYALARGPPVSA